MRGGGYADVLPVLQVPGNKVDAVPCERLLFFKASVNLVGYATRFRLPIYTMDGMSAYSPIHIGNHCKRSQAGSLSVHSTR